MSFSDAMLSISLYDPITQARMREWYPRLNSAKNAVFNAWKGLEHIFLEPTIPVYYGDYTKKRDKILSDWTTAWQTWTQLVNDFKIASTTASPTAPSASLAEQVAFLQQQIAQLSNRLASSESVDQNPK